MENGGSQSWFMISRELEGETDLETIFHFSFLFLRTLFSVLQTEKCMQLPWKWADSREKANPDFTRYPFVLKSFLFKKTIQIISSL